MLPRRDGSEPGAVWRRCWQWLSAALRRDDRVRGLREERRALQSALLRKRRNDAVRHAEIDQLRALMRGQARPAAAAPPATPRSIIPQPSTGATRQRLGLQARTAQQIAELESALARQWNEVANQTASAPSATSSAAAKAPPTVAARAMPIDLVHADAVTSQAGLEPAWTHPALVEAAVAAANGRWDAARAALARVLALSAAEPAAVRCLGRWMARDFDVACALPQTGRAQRDAAAVEAEAHTVLASESEFPAIDAPWPGRPVDTAAPALTLPLPAMLLGPLTAELARWDEALAAAMPPHPGASRCRLDAQAVQCVDFAGLGALLQWVLAARARGLQIELEGLSAWLAVLGHVVGIHTATSMRLRQYGP
jgi:ABC-type transporter Mla MlaB component